MTTAYTQNQIAEGKIAMAIQRLGEKFPFHAFIAGQFVFRPCPEAKPASVTVEGDSIVLLYRAEFVEKSTLPHLEAVLQQEVDQLVLRHVLVDPAEFKETRAPKIAEKEVSDIECVSDRLPVDATTCKSLPNLPPLESPCKRRKRPRKVKPRKPIELSPPGTCFAANSVSIPPLNRPPGECNSGAMATIDNHAVGASARQDQPRSAKVVRDAVRDAVITVGSDQVPEWLQGEIVAMGIGNQPGSDVEQLGRDRVGRQNWILALQRYVGRALQARPDFLRPPRRFPQLAGIVPGRRYRASRPRIMAVIDTSGSLDAEMLKVISAELARMAKQFNVTVVECDVKIHRVYPYKPIESVHGRGGTDLCPPFKPKFLKEHKPDVLIYFTDGFGQAPKTAPRVPVIWCLTPGGVCPATWGRTLRMESGDQK